MGYLFRISSAKSGMKALAVLCLLLATLGCSGASVARENSAPTDPAQKPEMPADVDRDASGALTLEAKKRIYDECVIAHEDAKKVARKHPRREDTYDKEYDRLIAPTLKRYGLQDWETEAIVVEGGKKHWPTSIVRLF